MQEIKREMESDDQSVDEDDLLKRFKCAACSKAFALLKQLNAHLKIHSKKRPFQCDFCDKTFKTKRALSSHRNRHTQETQYECKICFKKCLYASTLAYHLSTHSFAEKCTYCYVKFENKKQLAEHLGTCTSMHAKKCDFCSMTFLRQWELKAHLNSHELERNNLNACNVCHEKFLSLTDLRSHLTAHSDKYPFECTICNVRFKLHSVFYEHQKTHAK